MTPTDPLYAQQWHFSLIGAIETIWQEFTGAGVTVAVYDGGVQYTHPDLNDNYDAQRHFTYNDFIYDGAPVYSVYAHGTAVAGLIGAEAGNGIGGVGVAFGATLTSQNFLDVTQFSLDETPEEEAAFLWAAGFDIMNNSWGSDPLYEAFQNLADPESDRSRLDGFYATLSATGRGGLGTIIVQAAGNETLNANADRLNTSRHTITVAATEQTGFVADYSNFGHSLLVAAPAAAVTTDMLRNAGYNTVSDDDPLDVDYTGTFDGTSAATPVVAGVVALMLEANPDLGWRDVQDILALSARHTGSTYGNPAGGDEVGRWERQNSFITGSNFWNGGGTAYNPSYGYGMVDAHGATRMAEAWSKMFDAPKTSANEVSFGAAYVGNPPFSDTLPRPLVDPEFSSSATIAFDIQVRDVILIDTVYVSFQMTHSRASDLVIALITPTQNRIVLMDKEGGADLMDDGFSWTFAVESLRGQSTEGRWSLNVTDTLTGATGTMEAFSLQFFGSGGSLNDVYHFTDDYLSYTAVGFMEPTLDDRDQRGVDWLNFSAVTGDIVADMNGDGQMRVAGAAWFSLSSRPNAFENFHAGDGNDIITGNSADNTVYGARGRDFCQANSATTCSTVAQATTG